MIIQSSFIAEAPKPEPNIGGGSSDQLPAPKKPRKVKLTVETQEMTDGQYRKILSAQLQALVGLNEADEIELEIDLQ
ncbi:MAG: hypothetical protein AB7S77_22830 [Desulfatirhabdiaceae bacterium]